VEVNSYVLKS